MEKIIRRELQDYVLPSESKQILTSFVGKTIGKLYTGIFSNSFNEFMEKEKIESIESVINIPHGGPFMLITKNGAGIAFGYDSFLASVVIKIILLDNEMDDTDILSELYKGDDYTPYFLKAKCLIDLTNNSNLENKIITSVSIYKYPDNFKQKKVNYDFINEVGVCFKLENGEKYLFMTGLNKKYTSSGISIMKFSEIKSEDLVELKCSWSSDIVT